MLACGNAESQLNLTITFSIDFILYDDQILIDFNKFAKFTSAIFFIALFDQSQLASVLKFIFWYFCHFGEFMKYTYFILTIVISDLLSKSKAFQGLF